MAGSDRQRGDRNDQGQLGRAVDGKGEAVPKAELASIEQQRRHAPDDEEQPDEHRHLERRRCARGERVEVEGHAAGDEEERDQEAIPDGVQLRVEDADLATTQGDARDHARNEAAEQKVEAELRSQRDEAEDEYHGQPHGELARGLERLLDQRPSAPRRADGEEPSEHRQHDEDHQDHRLMQRVPGGQDQGHQQDRAELADRPRSEEVGPEGGSHLARVAQDRDQCSDRRCRHRRPGVEEREDDSGGGQRSADPIGEGERDGPAHHRKLERTAPDPFEVDLVAGEEEEHSQAEVPEE